MTSDIDPIQAAIEWVNSNYPPSGGEPSDKDQLVELTTQKGEQVSRILVEMQKSLFAIHRMADMPAKERPELKEMKDRLPQELDRPTDVPLPDFVKSLKRILSDNYTTENRRENGYAMSIFMHKMTKDKQPSSGYDSYLNRITATNLDPVWYARHAVREGKYYVKWVNWYIYVDLLTIYHIYRYLLPELQNPHPLFLLQVSKAETSLVEIVAGVTAEIHRAESPATLTHPRRGAALLAAWLQRTPPAWKPPLRYLGTSRKVRANCSTSIPTRRMVSS